MNCCVAMFVEGGADLADGLMQVFEQHRRVFGKRDLYVFVPEGHPLQAPVQELWPRVFLRRIPAVCCQSPSYADAFRLTTDFYDMFRGYDYVLVSSVHTWPLYDALDWWASRGCDYIAAPWMDLAGGGSEWTRNLDLPRGGRGGASLRHVANCREYVRRLQTCEFDFGRTFMWDDVVLSGGLPNNVRQVMPELRYFARSEQARFAWDKPHLRGENLYGSCVDTLMDITRGHLPMLLYQPSEGVVDRLCRPEREPEDIFLLSSAVRPQYDYRSLVDGVAPDRGRRLLVCFNDCAPVLRNDSGFALLQEQGHVLTFHNDTVAEPFGPSNFGEVPFRFAQRGFEGRHDSRTLSWRPIVSQQLPVVTYDGEVEDTESTESLRTIGSEVPGTASPTSGYMAYTILRRKYPRARIHLVNFFGNTRGFQVCVRHDPTWEQSVYRRDPLADFLDASTKMS